MNKRCAWYRIPGTHHDHRGYPEYAYRWFVWDMRVAQIRTAQGAKTTPGWRVN